MFGKSAASRAATPEAAFRALIRVYGLVRRVMDPYFSRHGISGSQWGVLRALHRAEKEGLRGLRLTDLSERLLVRPPSVTGVIDRLERLGLVARSASSTDLRSKRVSLTPTGRELMEGVLAGHAAQIRAVMGGLSVQEQGQFLRLLERLGLHLESSMDREESAVRDSGGDFTQ